MAMYFKITEIPPTVKELLEVFYSEKQIYSHAAYGQITYIDELCNYMQCDTGKYRSFDDLFEICQTYFPDTTTLEVTKALLDLDIYNDSLSAYFKPHLGVCGTMHKIRYIPYQSEGYGDIKTKMSRSKYTWDELLSPLGINNIDDYLKYLKNRKLINK